MDWKDYHKVTCGRYNKPITVNQACLYIDSYFGDPLKFYLRNTECYECDFFVEGNEISPMSNTSYIMDTRYGYESYLYDGKSKYCEMTNYFKDFGVYYFNFSNSQCSDIKVLKEPEKIWVNFGLTICFYLLGAAVFCLLRYLCKYCSSLSSSNISLRELEMDLGNPNSREERKSLVKRQSRITAIDTFRGISIILMIFVNYGGGDYTVFRHTPWNGLSIADLVFPWFVWLMGASAVLSLRSGLRIYTSKKKLFCKILKRTTLLIIFGIILNSGKRYNNFLRVSGVLQRLGITYFFVASFELLKAKPQRNERFGPWFYCQDIIDSWMQWIFAICLSLTHELITFFLQVPGCPTGYLGAGGFSEHSKFKNCTGGAAGYIDRLVITENHMYHHGTYFKIYKPPVAYDPEGILGTLTSIFCAFLGAHAGRIILSFNDPYSRIRQWLVWSIICGVAAGMLCNWSQNGGIIPINKNLWSLSYVLATSSLAFIILSLCYCLIDFAHVWNGVPFMYPGMNAITLYLGHSLLKEQLPWRWVPFTNTHFEVFIMDLTATIIWSMISYVLYKYNIFITL